MSRYNNAVKHLLSYLTEITIDKAESMNIQVLYGDTDSVFLSNPAISRIIRVACKSPKSSSLLILMRWRKSFSGKCFR